MLNKILGKKMQIYPKLYKFNFKKNRSGVLWKIFGLNYSTVKPLKTNSLQRFTIYYLSMFDVDLFAQSTVYNFLASKHHYSWAKKEIDKGRCKEKIKEEGNGWWIIKQRSFFFRTEFDLWHWLTCIFEVRSITCGNL